ncbi:hypothetical protein GIV40_10775 [Pseudomonas poae]|nr:hypothetical protein [Pseudomonas poae]
MDLESIFAPQNRRLIKLTTSTLELQELLLENFNGTEGLSLLFNFTLSMLSQDPALELKTLIGKPASLGKLRSTCHAAAASPNFLGTQRYLPKNDRCFVY